VDLDVAEETAVLVDDTIETELRDEAERVVVGVDKTVVGVCEAGVVCVGVALVSRFKTMGVTPAVEGCVL